MVYTGKPSTGCLNCRKRHIKCDEATPSCQRCLKRNLICPGYRTQFEIAYRDQNAVAENGVRRRKNASQKACRELVVPERQQNTTSALPSLAQDFQTYAFNFLFLAYIHPSWDKAQRGFLNAVQPVWELSVRARPSSPLVPALCAVASWLLEAWSEMNPDSADSFSRSQYIKAVAAIRRSLERVDEITDDVLMAVLMLSMYDGLNCFLKMIPEKSPHLDGVAALLQSRTQLPMTSAISRRVLLGARNKVISRALTRGEPMPDNLCVLSDIAGDAPNRHALAFDDLNIGVANLQGMATKIKQSSRPNASLVRETLEQAYKLDQKLLMWRDSVPVEWNPITATGPECIPQSVKDAGLWQEHCYIYESTFICFLMNSYACSRIRIQMVIIACLERQLYNDKCSSMLERATGVVQQLADDVCASVPFHLGDRIGYSRVDETSAKYPSFPGVPVPPDHHIEAAASGGWCMAPRLGDLLTLNAPLEEAQKAWIMGQLKRIRAIYAIGPAAMKPFPKNLNHFSPAEGILPYNPTMDPAGASNFLIKSESLSASPCPSWNV